TLYNFQSWGTGFTAGVIADLHIRDYLAIEPGVFLESRSGHSSFIAGRYDDSSVPYYVTQEAHRHTYNLTVPVVASVRLNLSERLRWHIDFGPYIAFLLKSKLENKELISTRPDLSNEVPFSTDPSSVDFGFKMGTGFELSRHLYFGIHYEAGAVKAYRNKDMGDHLLMSYGGRTKAWNFTVGWNF
ncbi:MAG: PorT family protein, partial [Muribaculaceae bacterium]|nr:PorT family protein [Muribaculaceae bacterium]